MKGRKTSWADAVLWSFLLAVVVTGIVHGLAIGLPDWLSSGAARESSAFERFAHRFSEYWLTNAVWLAATVAAGSFTIAFPLLLWRAILSSRRGSGAEPVPPPPGNS